MKSFRRENNLKNIHIHDSQIFMNLRSYRYADITNGGFQSSADENNTSMNLMGTAFRGSVTSSTTTTTLIPITRIITLASKTTNHESLSDDMNNFAVTQPTIISEPYFDVQTPRNVTGLVGEESIFQDYFPIF
jgi:hypothetical protein